MIRIKSVVLFVLSFLSKNLTMPPILSIEEGILDLRAAEMIHVNLAFIPFVENSSKQEIAINTSTDLSAKVNLFDS
jgi:hypothetical protein